MSEQKGNFFKDDPRLKEKIVQLDGVSTKAAFSNWKGSFLEVVMTFLDQLGSVKAEGAYEAFKVHVTSLEKAKGKLETCLENGSLSHEKASVKARRFLAELKAALTTMSAQLQLLLPGNKAEVVEYSNFHMGAILVREGFQSYTNLEECDNALMHLKDEALQYVADKQLLAEIDNYHDKLKMFCAIMADLGLMKIVNKAQEVAKIPPEVEEDPAEDLEIFKPEALRAPAANGNSGPEKPSPAAAPPQKAEKVVEPPKEEDPAPPPEKAKERVAPKAPTPPPPKEEPAPVAAPATPAEQERQRQLQTITITTINDDPPDVAAPAPATAPRRKTVKKKGPKKDGPDDLPRTTKPKAKAKLPGNNVGRGAGRMLSKEEAKEKRIKAPPQRKLSSDHIGMVKKPAPPKKKKPVKDKEEEEPEEDDNSASDDEDNAEDVGKVKDEATPVKDSKKGQSSKQAPGSEKKTKAAAKTKQAAAVPADAKKKQRERAAAAKKAANQVPIQVHKVDGTKIQLMVDPMRDTLGDIKKQLEKKTGMPIERQRISIKYLDKELTLPEKTLAFYGVKQDSDLDLDPVWIEVNAEMPDKKRHSIRVTPASDTSHILKDKIAKESGLAAPRQVLKFNGKELPDGNKTAKEMGIQDGSTLQVEIMTKVPITVTNTTNGKKIKLMVEPTKDKLGDIKERLEKVSGIFRNNQKLSMHNGPELVDEEAKFAQDYGIQQNSELDLEPLSLQVTVVMPNGTTHKIRVKLASDMSDLIKEMVKNEPDLDCASGGQVFKYSNKELPKGITFKDMGIRDGSKIMLELN